MRTVMCHDYLMSTLRTFSVGALIALALPFLTHAATLQELHAQVARLMQQLSAVQSQQGSALNTPSSSGAPTHCPTLARTLSRGTKGTDVTQLQTFLISHSHLAAGNNTGFYGSLTEKAVQAFQKKHSLVSSGTPASTGYGTVGAKTRAAIATQCKKAAIAPSYAQGSYTQPDIPQSTIYFWQTGGWSTCANSSQSRTVSCISSTNTTVSDSFCTGTKPAATQSCTSVTPSQSCTFNNQTVAHGASVAAYQTSSVPAGQVCASQQRTCTNGTLSGTYGYASCTASAHGNAIDVFLIAGQSNAVGYGTSALSPAPTAGKVFKYTGSSVVAATDPFGSGTGSAWPTFGNRYHALTGRAVGFVPAAVAGTGQVNNGDGAANWDTTGELWGNSVTSLNAAMTAFTAAGYTPTFKGVLWVQGETDAGYVGNGTYSAQRYKDALSAMIARYRTQYGSTMPFYIFRTGTAFNYQGLAAVQAAQEQIATADPYTTIAFRGATYFGGWNWTTSTVHYTQDGYNLMGRISAENVVAGIDDATPYVESGPPGSASCTFNGQNITNGQSVTAYQAATVPSGSTCASQQRSCSNGTLSGTYTYASCSVQAAQATTPLIGAIRWDAWFPGNTSVLSEYLPSNLLTRWGYREPSYGWYDVGVSNAQSIIDQEIKDAADAGLDFWIFNDYKHAETAAGWENRTQLHGAYKLYQASSQKHRIKFGFFQMPAGLRFVANDYWNTVYLPYLAQSFADPQYLKVNGNRPVLFVPGIVGYGGGMDALSTGERATLNALNAANGIGEVFVIATAVPPSGMQAAASSQTHKIDAFSSYGVMGNAAKPEMTYCTVDPGDSNYHCPFSSQAAVDKSNWQAAAQGGFVSVPGLTPVNDSRALTTPYGFYVDQPTYSEWLTHLNEAKTFISTNPSRTTAPGLALIYAWNELAEGGPGIIPTKQNGKMYLNAITAVKSGNLNAAQSNVLNGDNKLIARTGNWINYSPVIGAFNNDEQISQWAGDTATVYGQRATHFEIRGVKGPNRGKMEVFVDGTSKGVVDLYSVDWQLNQTLYSQPTSGAGLHQLKVVNVSTDAAVSQVGIDSIVITEQP